MSRAQAAPIPDAAPEMSATGLRRSNCMASIGHVGPVLSTGSPAPIPRAISRLHDTLCAAIRADPIWIDLCGAHVRLRHLRARRGADRDRADRQARAV